MSARENLLGALQGGPMTLDELAEKLGGERKKVVWTVNDCVKETLVARQMIDGALGYRLTVAGRAWTPKRGATKAQRSGVNDLAGNRRKQAEKASKAEPVHQAAEPVHSPVHSDSEMSLMNVIADIREAIGDKGETMLGELAGKVRGVVKDAARFYRLLCDVRHAAELDIDTTPIELLPDAIRNMRTLAEHDSVYVTHDQAAEVLRKLIAGTGAALIRLQVVGEDFSGAVQVKHRRGLRNTCTRRTPQSPAASASGSPRPGRRHSLDAALMAACEWAYRAGLDDGCEVTVPGETGADNCSTAGPEANVCSADSAAVARNRRANVQNIGFTCAHVQGGVIWKTWPEDMADGTQLYTHLVVTDEAQNAEFGVWPVCARSPAATGCASNGNYNERTGK